MNESNKIKQLQDDIKKIKNFITEIERIGGRMPILKKAVERLEVAINTGADVVASAQAVKKTLAEYTNDLYKACGDDYVCRAKIDRKYQARSVEWNLSWDKKGSTVRQFIRNSLRRYLPEQICKRFEFM